MKANLSPIERVISAIIVLAVVAALLSIPWLIWTAVLPYFWPEGPERFINPPFWMFLGAWYVVNLVTRALGLRK